jgi:hypothetical protein
MQQWFSDLNGSELFISFPGTKVTYLYFLNLSLELFSAW